MCLRRIAIALRRRSGWNASRPIATDLHDDIGASLAQIAILSEVARVNGNGAGRPGEPLERVAILARELVDSMGDIVWSIRPRTRHGVSDPSHARICPRPALLPRHRFRIAHAEAGKDVELSLQARRQVFLIFKECIHNAARHSRCTAVMAELKVAGREAVLTVRDNGTGLRPEDKLTGGTGIPNMRRRSGSWAAACN